MVEVFCVDLADNPYPNWDRKRRDFFQSGPGPPVDRPTAQESQYFPASAPIMVSSRVVQFRWLVPLFFAFLVPNFRSSTSFRIQKRVRPEQVQRKAKSK